MSDFDRAKSLQELEGKDWGEPTYSSHLVTECHRLRRVPLQDFTAGDLRIMIGQQIGLPYLIPLAIESLQSDPLIEGDFYRGDLLVSVLRVESPFWSDHPDCRQQVTDIVSRAFSVLTTLDVIERKITEESLTAACSVFRGNPRTDSVTE
jgi:hypothetical protein